MRTLYGGVETGGTWCVCAMGSGSGELECVEKFPITAPAETIARIVEFFTSGPRPIAVGIGSFGPVDVDPTSPGWGSVTTTPKPGWQNVSIARVVQDARAVPITFDHDVAVAALGEHRWGAGRDVAALSYVTAGTGIGAGLLIRALVAELPARPDLELALMICLAAPAGRAAAARPGVADGCRAGDRSRRSPRPPHRSHTGSGDPGRDGRRRPPPRGARS